MEVKYIMKRFCRKSKYNFKFLWMEILITIILPPVFICLLKRYLKVEKISIIGTDFKLTETPPVALAYAFILMITVVVISILNRKYGKPIMVKGNDYFEGGFSKFRLLYKIYGKRKIKLIRIPIHLQFQIIHECIFEIIEDENEEVRNNITYNESVFAEKENSDTINIMIGDTYPISYEQIHENYLNYRTYILNRKGNDETTRFHNDTLEKRIHEILKETNAKKINLFLHTCTTTNLYLCKNIISTGGRSGKIYHVLQYEQNVDKFEETNTYLK